MTRGRCRSCDRLVQLSGRRALCGPMLDYRPVPHELPPEHVGCGGSVHEVARVHRIADWSDESIEVRHLECNQCGKTIESYAEECRERGACDGHETPL